MRRNPTFLGDPKTTPLHSSSWYLVSDWQAAPTLVPRDGGLGPPDHDTVQIQGLSFRHCGR